MTVIAWTILTTAQKAAADAITSPHAGIMTRPIENPLANNIGEGTLVGKHVLPARIVSDPLYTPWWDVLSPLPVRVMDSDVLFPYVEPL